VTGIRLRRLLALVVHNWPLKLAAILLATLLYAGVVLSENVQTFGASIPIEPVRQPANAVIVGNLPPVTNIRYVAPTDVAGRLSREGFRASIDLGAAAPTPDNPYVTVRVDLRYADDRVRILDYSPQVVQVRLDPLVQKTVPVEVDHPPVPSGLQVSEPVLSSPTAVISGPDSVVRLAVAAQARVLIQPTGINVDQTVPIVAVDQVGNELGPVRIQPDQVHVSIHVSGVTNTKTVPVNPVLSGTPAVGFELASVAASPAVVTVSGDPNALGSLTKIDTAPVSIGGASRTVTSTVGLALPDGLSAISDQQVVVTAELRAVRGSASFAVGIQLAGARSDRTYDLSTDQVTLTLGGPIAALDAVDAASLAAVADVGGLGIGSHTVRVSLTPPGGTSIVSISPGSLVVRVAGPEPSPTATPTAPPPAEPSPSGGP
jgi:YbbR domain-containing protein